MSLEEELARTARSKNVTISLAESCTGGLASDLITNVPGSSAYFLGSVVCYSDPSKIELDRGDRGRAFARHRRTIGSHEHGRFAGPFADIFGEELLHLARRAGFDAGFHVVHRPAWRQFNFRLAGRRGFLGGVGDGQRADERGDAGGGDERGYDQFSVAHRDLK